MPAKHGTKYDPITKKCYAISPIVAPDRSYGQHTLHMMAAIRKRQNIEADYFDALRIAYDWKILSKRRLPRSYKVSVGDGIRWMEENLGNSMK